MLPMVPTIVTNTDTPNARIKTGVSKMYSYASSVNPRGKIMPGFAETWDPPLSDLASTFIIGNKVTSVASASTP
jgi:hypothetical protein